MAPALHTLDHKYIFGENRFPLRGITCTQVLACAGLRIVKVDVLQCLFRAFGLQNNRESMVAVHAQQNIGEGGDVLRRFVPFGVQIGKIGKDLFIVALDLALNQCALSRKQPRLFNVVVIFEA